MLKKRGRRVLALALCVCVAWLCAGQVFAAGEPAPDPPSKFYRWGYNLTDTLLMGAVGAVGKLFPEPRWPSAKTYTNPHFFAGTTPFLQAPAANAAWRLGYASESLLTEDLLDGKHFVGGSLAVNEAKTVTAVLDDLRVRTVAVNDGSGRGTVVFAALDAYGLANTAVNAIRAQLMDFAAQEGIVSLNLSALHQHSAVDTFGMNGDIWQVLLKNPIANLLHPNQPLYNGQNPAYMAHLAAATQKAVRDAVQNMTPGKLYYGTTDVEDFIWDRRAPFVNDTSMARFRFAPTDGSTETWLCTSMIHCVGNGAAGREVTGDYPYFVEQQIGEKANFMLLMGAQQSNSMQRGTQNLPSLKEGMSGYETLELFGRALGDKLLGVLNETEVEPLLNLRHAQVQVPISNQILLVGGKNGMFTNQVVKTRRGYRVATEIGYMELGSDLAFALVPGELAPELAYGGCLQADKSWSGKDWTLPSLQELVAQTGSKRTLRVLGLTNDQIGYIVPDNNYMPVLAPEGQSVEFVSCGAQTASTLVTAFEALIGA
ncbi:MAG: hypothetical protein LBB50_04230 [Oscillospiraceae bacterium]|nr:hypothetical protein [Oscillospiraceae bacterium]